MNWNLKRIGRIACVAAIFLTSCLAWPHFAWAAAEARPKLTGTVFDEGGDPLAQATVFVYTAAPRQGVGVLCPSCYPDCEKKATTDAQGRFTIESLDPSLVFRLLAVAKGYRPEFVEKVDPAKGEPVEAVLRTVFEGDEPKQQARGRVVNAAGAPVPGAVVSVHGVRRGDSTRYGGNSDIDPVAVSDAAGEFTIRGIREFDALVVDVEGRGYGPARSSALVSGERVSELRLTEGGSVKGRVVQEGKPLGGIEVGIAGADRSSETFAGHYSVATDDEGRFLFVNLPPKKEYLLCGKMASLGERGALPARRVRVGEDGSLLDAGDLKVERGWVVAGLLKLVEDEPVAEGTRVVLSQDEAWDSAEARTDEQGRFRFVGVPAGKMNVSIGLRGYRLSARNASLDLLNPFRLRGRVESNKTNLVVEVEPGERRGSLMSDGTDLSEEPLQGVEPAVPSPNMLRVEGQVADADSHAPVASFTVTEGRPSRYNRGVGWLPTRKTTHTNGAFTVYLARRDQASAVLVEAEGYLPWAMEKLDASKTNLTVALKKGTGPRGVLLKADGQPAEGVTVYLADLQRGLYLSEPDLRVNEHMPGSLAQVATDAAGRFSFPPRLELGSIVVADDEGFLEVAPAELRTNAEVKLQPWARIEGRLLIGAKPGAQERIRLGQVHIPVANEPYRPPAVQFYQSATTDEEGKFVFERVPPQWVQVYHEPKVRDSRSGMIPMSQDQKLELQPGESRTLTLGGRGRPVIGRMVLKGYAGKIDWRADVQSLRGIPRTPRPSMAELEAANKKYAAALAAAKTAAERAAAKEEYLREHRRLSDQLKSLMAGTPSREAILAQSAYALNFKQDGSFRVEDVPGGRYMLRVDLRSPDLEGNQRWSAPPLASHQREIEVPEAPGGRTDEPLDLGTIELTAEKAAPRR